METQNRLMDTVGRGRGQRKERVGCMETEAWKCT